MALPILDPDRLLRLRVVVARFGEKDVSDWWFTKGQLGTVGAVAEARPSRSARELAERMVT